ncbi:hypothetical protein Ahy_A09g046237 isoform A [Arachis hypogaea]|uniref:Uncharacterized protein n=1 Tax=Arachis hypogaea TaxID=3818 RepID=A0A445BP81_ARAHY|nr:hypothetical protein Ahy_A09g046237 isoform A [Arachis hypogaea]
MVKGITDYQEKKKKAINGCLFALMIIYFHLSKNKGNNRTERPPKPWIANWTKEQLVERMTEEREEILVKWTPEKESRGKRSQILIQNLNLNQVIKKEKKKKKTKTTPKKTQQKKKKVVVEDSPPEEDQYFDGERYEISSDELDELLREDVDKSAAEGENQAELRSTEGRYVSSET